MSDAPMPKMIADLVMASIADKDKRIAELEVMLRELVTTFNPEPKSDHEPLSLWDRAAKVLAHGWDV